MQASSRRPTGCTGRCGDGVYDRRVETPFWLDEPAETLGGGRIESPIDVAIIGGGVTGCSCAHTLADAGIRFRLYEARTIASGASGRNGGFALRGGAMHYDVARARFGPERAAAFWHMTERALDRMAELAGDALRRVGSLRLAVDEQERDEVRAEHDALLTDGFGVEWIDELPEPLAGTYHAAILHPEDGALPRALGPSSGVQGRRGGSGDP